MNKKIELDINERLRLFIILRIKIEDNDEFIKKFEHDEGLNIVIQHTKDENETLKKIAFKLDVL